MSDDVAVKSDEYHVASFIAHAVLQNIEEIKQKISAITGAEIHATSETGKIVFTIEASSQKQIGRCTEQIQNSTGLLSLSPVYHQFLNEE